MRQPLSARIKRYFLFYLHAQLVVTLVSLPILVAWGLPISIMSVVGNFIFSPIMTFFLMLCSLLFVTTLLGIPNGWLVVALERCQQLFSWLLSFGKKEWLVCFSKPSLIFLIIVPICTYLLVRSRRFNTPHKQLIPLFVLLLIISGYLSLGGNKATSRLTFLPQCDEKLLLYHHEDGSMSLIDRGCFNRKGNPASFVEFELAIYLRKQFGVQTVRNLVLLKPSSRSFEAASALSKLLSIQRLAIPIFDTLTNKTAWRSFFELKKTVETERISLVRFAQSP